MPGTLDGKIALIVGIANHRSIAWGIAQAMHHAGARLVLSYQGERVSRDVISLAGELPGTLTTQMDVTNQAEVDALFAMIEREMGGLDTLVHSIAFAPRETLGGRFSDVTQEAFATTMNISAFSLQTLARGARPLMLARGGGSVTTLTYIGGERVIPNYHLIGVAKMALHGIVLQLANDLGPEGIRVNEISSGPVLTLSARAIRDFNAMRQGARNSSPMRQDVDPVRDLGGTAVFLASDASSMITGQTIYVDGGFHILGSTISSDQAGGAAPA